jgi:hypothetical protein
MCSTVLEASFKIIICSFPVSIRTNCHFDPFQQLRCSAFEWLTIHTDSWHSCKDVRFSQRSLLRILSSRSHAERSVGTRPPFGRSIPPESSRRVSLAGKQRVAGSKLGWVEAMCGSVSTDCTGVLSTHLSVRLSSFIPNTKFIAEGNFSSKQNLCNLVHL